MNFLECPKLVTEVTTGTVSTEEKLVKLPAILALVLVIFCLRID